MRLTIERDTTERAARNRAIALRLDGRAWLRVTAEELGELDVSDGELVEETRRAEIEGLVARVRARRFVVRSLAARAQSVAEIDRKLAARDVPEDVARAAIERAVSYGYLDDAALAGQLARGMRSRGYGRRRAERTLRDRRLSAELAEAALDDAYGEIDETALARETLGTRSVADDAARRRAAAFLTRRGFSGAATWEAVRQAEKDGPSDRE